MNNQELTLLSEGQIWGNSSEKQLEVLQKYGRAAAISDLCAVTGCYLADDYYSVADFTLDKSGMGTSRFWTKSDDKENSVRIVDESGMKDIVAGFTRSCAIRPVLQSLAIYSQIALKKVRGFNGTYEVEYGEYPQYAVDGSMQKKLELELCRGLKTTGRNYTFDSVKNYYYHTDFGGATYDEYEYQKRKYIRVKVKIDSDSVDYESANGCKLSNGIQYKDGDFVWIEVSPVKWLVDDKTGTLISKIGLVSGIRFNDFGYKGDFERTEMKSYLDKYMSRDLFQSEVLIGVQDMSFEGKKQYEKDLSRVEKRKNPYGFKYGKVSEEEIIKGAIESGVAVFLHGPSSEGKSARVKQIDPTCEIIYLRNATPDSLNGKSVYDSQKGEMLDIPPTWLKKLQVKCAEEPDRFHVVFFDEITNALPSIQGIAFNIILDREVNGIWQLPENARIVAAGNDMKDSLAANQLAEPLFNRFAHVYIKTTTESWLKWASEHNIHPAIYSYIAFKNGETLRSEYNGKTPNADPRKWEMASKMLYATGSPEMLRSLVGEDITREFVQFCNQPVIALDDVITGNYSESDIQLLNTAERYATTMGLSQVDSEHLDAVRGFVIKMGAEFGAIFDSLWIHGDETRLERIAEAQLATAQMGGIKR